MIIPSGSQNIYRTTMVLSSVGGHFSVFTGHYAAIIPGTNDSAGNAADAFVSSYAPFIQAFCLSDSGTLNGAGEAALARIDPTAPISGPVGTPIRTGANPCPEAGFRIRRVGAAGATSINGRIRIGPVVESLYLDPPRYRRIDVANPVLVGLLATLQAKTNATFFGMQEVLWNRFTGDAVLVDSWGIPRYTSRVWARAGYPQGKRGPDRP